MRLEHFVTGAVLAHASYAQLAAQSVWSLLSYDNNQWSSIEERDVCVIGGGSSGIHAAVRLTDMNQTVAVVEQRGYLGGHTFTFRDPETKQTFDIGVIVFQPWKVVQNYFARFNVPLVNETSLDPNKLPYACWSYNTTQEYFVDFRNGLPVEYNPFPNGFQEGIADVIKVLSEYKSLLTSYDLPSPVPEDLYLPFGAFIDKHNLSSIARFNHFYNQGQGDVLNIPTIYIIKYFNLQDYLNVATGSGWLSTARYDTSELYTEASKYIGHQNIFLSSSIITTSRPTTNTSTPFEILISTPTTNLKLLKCQKILSTIPPTLSNLANWDLTPSEQSIFSHFTTSNGYWTALVTNLSISKNLCFTNVASRPPYNLPVFPGLYSLSPWLANTRLSSVWNLKFSSPTPNLTEEQVKAMIKTQINTIQRFANVTETEPEYLVFHSHTPFQLQVSGSDIKDGFYDKLVALQGGLEGRMWYTGAAFHTHDSSFLWRYNEDVVLRGLMGKGYRVPFEGYVVGGT